MHEILLTPEARTKLDALRAVFEQAMVAHRASFGPPVSRLERAEKKPQREPHSQGRRTLTRRARLSKGGRR